MDGGDYYLVVVRYRGLINSCPMENLPSLVELGGQFPSYRVLPYGSAIAMKEQWIILGVRCHGQLYICNYDHFCFVFRSRLPIVSQTMDLLSFRLNEADRQILDCAIKT